jgi:hypothetical protein
MSSLGCGAHVPSWLRGAVVVALLLAAGRQAWAADKVTAASCVQANEQASTLRASGKLRDARTQLRLCSAQGCPAAVRKDCIAGAAQADADVPTVAFAVQDADGNDLSAVTVSLDGQPLADKLDGKAIDVDPGEHLFRFESAGQPTVEKRLVIVEGEKNRRERITMGEPKPAPVVAVVPVAPPPVVHRQPPNKVKSAGLVVGATGLGLLAVGGLSGLLATLDWSAAKNACGPTYPLSCRDQPTANSDHKSTEVAGAVADIALGVGAVALVTGGVMILWPAPEGDRVGAARPTLTVAPQVGAGTGGVLLRGSF